MSSVTRIALIIGLLSVIIFSLYSLLLTSEVSDYTETINAERTEKDIWLSTDFNSPFAISNTPFQRLEYFEPDQDFRIKAKFIKSVSNEEVTLITNTGENQAYTIYGSAIFEFKGDNHILKLLQKEGNEQLFLPFIDKTSGNETYGAGRYLDLDYPINEEIILDFNRAYNPYCAYTEMYSCPFPPKSNILAIAIEAGEKTYPH
jgi:uncharacterized protein (DUF1684 family)